jgi:hypothetical protein
LVGKWWEDCGLYELRLDEVRITVAVVQVDGVWKVARESGKPAYTSHTDNSYTARTAWTSPPSTHHSPRPEAAVPTAAAEVSAPGGVATLLDGRRRVAVQSHTRGSVPDAGRTYRDGTGG